jgi:hypothetical protein
MSLDLSKFNKKVERKLKQITSKRQMQTLGLEALRLIRKRVRKGFSVAKNLGREEPFKPLDIDYIERRRKIRLSPFTSPSKSNITRSGRLISGLRLTTKDRVFQIKPTGKSREGVSNVFIAQVLTKQGRPFLNLSLTEQRKLLSFYKRIIKTLR